MDKKIGKQLADAREARSLSIAQVAEATHIREQYLIAMEAGNFDALPSSTQAKGFLRIYASFLGLHVDDLLENHSAEDNAVQEETDDNDTLAISENEPENKTADIDENSKEVPDDKLEHIEEIKSEDQAELNRKEEAVEKEQPESESFAPLTSTEADKIFKEVGETLKKQREMLSLSLVDVEFHTHVRVHYLEALEAGDIDSLPSPVQGKGMLKNFATFIGLDVDTLLLRYAEGLQQRLAAKHGISSAEFRNPARYNVVNRSGIRQFFSSDLLIGIAGALVLILFILWGAVRIFAVQSEQVPTQTAPSIADVLLATGTPSLTPTATGVTTVVPNAFPTRLLATGTLGVGDVPVAGEGKVQIYINVVQRAWMRVAVDDEVVFEERVLPGSAYSYVGDRKVEILTGNGGGLQVFYNQQDLGLMGSFGQVVLQIYTPQGIAVPTPTTSPTPTKTSRTTPTPTRTPTPVSGGATVPAIP